MPKAKSSKKNSTAFLRIPKALFTDKRYNSLSSDCKMMYALILDRVSLSEKNGWIDSDGRVFIYFTVEEFSQVLGICRDKTIKILGRLSDAGLIERKRRGLGKPSVIYACDVDFSDVSRSEKKTCKSRENRLQQVADFDCNNNEINNTDMNNNNIISSSALGVWNEVKEQIDYDFLCEIHGKTPIDEIVNLICDTLVCASPQIKLNGGAVPRSVVVARMRSLNCEHITYVLSVMAENTQKIRNVRVYMLSLLYNAPATMDGYYQMRVNSDV